MRLARLIEGRFGLVRASLLLLQSLRQQQVSNIRGCTAIAREYLRTASARSPSFSAIKPSPVIAIGAIGRSGALNQPRRIREEELRHVSSVSHRWNRLAGICGMGFVSRHR